MGRTIAVATAASCILWMLFSSSVQGQESGRIKSFYGTTRMLVLRDGSEYFIGDNVAVPLLRSGSKVKFVTEDRNGETVIIRLWIAD